MDEVDIETIGCQHLQLRNKLKGTAMQKLVLETIDKKEEDLSIKKILELASDHVQQYYIVQSPFKTEDKTFNIKNEFVHIDEFTGNVIVYIKEEIVNKKWKMCSNCGQYILAESQKTKKCRKCKKGFFRFQTKKYQEWKLKYAGSRDEVIQKLCEDKYLKHVTSLTKRADFFRYAEETFYIYESKNKELSGLSFSDLLSSLVYPLIIRKCGYKVRELKIIFNGSWTDDLYEQIQKGFADKYDFKVQFVPVKKYLNECGSDANSVKVTKIGNKYNYCIVHGSSDKITIDLRELKSPTQS